MLERSDEVVKLRGKMFLAQDMELDAINPILITFKSSIRETWRVILGSVS